MTHKVPKNLRIVSDVPILVTSPSPPINTLSQKADSQAFIFRHGKLGETCQGNITN